MKNGRNVFSLLLMAALFQTGMAQSQDWANLGKYQEQNAKLAAPAADEDRVVFMGNSITEGWYNHHPEFFDKTPYVDRGISGQTTPQMVLRFQQDVVALQPKVVVILAGTNDIAGNTGPTTLEQIMDNMKSMVQLAKANNIKVVLCSVLPAFDYPWAPGKEPNVKIPKLNGMLEAYAEEADVIYLDYFAAMDDGNNGLPKELSKDGVHPTDAGYAIMEPLVEKAIKKALSE